MANKIDNIYKCHVYYRLNSCLYIEQILVYAVKNYQLEIYRKLMIAFWEK